MSKILVADWRKEDYRGFLFVVHQDHGLLLLHCTRKKNKPPHWQLPGGHVDEDEFIAAAEQTKDPTEHLLLAAKAGAARELYEETGIDMLRQLHRLQPAPLYDTTSSSSGNNKDNKQRPTIMNLYKSRLFFYLSVTDDDFPNGGVTPMGTLGKQLQLKLSIEHAGFIFQPEPNVAAEMLQHHSGGKCAQALLMAQQRHGGSTSFAKSTKNDDAEASRDDGPVDLLAPPKNEPSGCCCGFFGSPPS